MAPKAEPLTLATTPSGTVSTYAPPGGPLEPVREVSPARSIKRVLTTDLALQEEEMKRSRKAIKEATRVLEYSDSTVRCWTVPRRCRRGFLDSSSHSFLHIPFLANSVRSSRTNSRRFAS